MKKVLLIKCKAKDLLIEIKKAVELNPTTSRI